MTISTAVERNDIVMKQQISLPTLRFTMVIPLTYEKDGVYPFTVKGLVPGAYPQTAAVAEFSRFLFWCPLTLPINFSQMLPFGRLGVDKVWNKPDFPDRAQFDQWKTEAESQFLTFNFGFELERFDVSAVYDPSFSFTLLFDSPESTPTSAPTLGASQAVGEPTNVALIVSLTIVGAIVIAVVIVFTVSPKARAFVRPYSQKRQDALPNVDSDGEPLTTQGGHHKKANCTQEAWVAASTPSK